MPENSEVFKILSGMASGASAINPVAAGVSALTSLIPIGLGIKQARDAKRLRSEAEGMDPTYSIPKEILEAERIYRGRMTGGLPGENMFSKQINQNSANNMGELRNLGSGEEMFKAFLDSNRDTVGSFDKLAIARATDKRQVEEDYAGALYKTGTYREKEFADKLRKFENKMADASAMYEGGWQNIFGGAEGISASAAAAFKPKMNQFYDLLKEMMGGSSEQ